METTSDSVQSVCPPGYMWWVPTGESAGEARPKCARGSESTDPSTQPPPCGA
jgi:hypothetical protein